jgi:NAD/NADP transhydrogenase alpha subunit
MTTSTIHHRPAPFIAAAAVVAALAAGTVAVSLSHDGGHPNAPGQQSQTSVQQEPQRGHHFQPTTSGGHVLLGP